jgi:hypothetical protein
VGGRRFAGSPRQRIQFLASELKLRDGAPTEIHSDSSGVALESHRGPDLDYGLRSARNQSGREKDSSPEGHV